MMIRIMGPVIVLNIHFSVPGTDSVQILCQTPKFPYIHRLRRPENYFFSLSEKIFSGWKYPKKRFLFSFENAVPENHWRVPVRRELVLRRVVP